jgi:hypothetical protein
VQHFSWKVGMESSLLTHRHKGCENVSVILKIHIFCGMKNRVFWIRARSSWQALLNRVMNIRFHKGLENCQLLKKDSGAWSTD